MKENISTILLKDKRCLKGRTANPYILVNIDNNNKILLEVTKTYVKYNNIEEFYFLWQDLNDNEKYFFNELYCNVEVIFVYQFSSYKRNKTKQKQSKRPLKKIKKIIKNINYKK